MSSSILALLCFATWTIVTALVMVNHRVFFVLTGRRRINTFDGVAVSPFQARACRVHANCYENLPVFASLVLGAAVAGKGAVTDPLAMIVIYARVVQSTVHLLSTSEIAVIIRATFWTVQVLIMASWALRLLLG
jgi:uncharacterized MAPEG superfamily protein